MEHAVKRLSLLVGKVVSHLLLFMVSVYELHNITRYD